MLLSLSILADRLSHYKVFCSVANTDRSLRGVRVAVEGQKLQDDIVYLYQKEDGVLCKNREDYLFLHKGEKEQVLNEILNIFDLYSSWYEEIISNIYTTTQRSVLEKSSKVLDAFLLLIGLRTLKADWGGDSSQINGLPFLEDIIRNGEVQTEAYFSFKKRNRDYQVAENSICRLYSSGSAQIAVCPLFANGMESGVLIACTEQITRGKLELLEETATLLEQWRAVNSSFSRQWVQDSFLADILKGRILDRRQIINYFLSFGIRTNSPYRIGYLLFSSENMIPQAAAAAAITKHIATAFLWEDSESANGLILCYYGEQNKHKARRKQLLSLLNGLSFTFGESSWESDWVKISCRLREAKAAAAYGKHDVCGVSQYDTAFLPIVKRTLDQTDVICEIPALRTLKQYDNVYGSKYYHTLKAYLNNGMSKTKTYEELKISKTTLQTRMKKIEDILGVDPEQPDIRLAMELSIYLTDNDEPDDS